MKELYITYNALRSGPVNTVTFMFAHMEKMANTKKWDIVIGGLITSIDVTLGLSAEISQLQPIADNTALESFAWKLIKMRDHHSYVFMIRNKNIKHGANESDNHQHTRWGKLALHSGYWCPLWYWGRYPHPTCHHPFYLSSTNPNLLTHNNTNLNPSTYAL